MTNINEVIITVIPKTTALFLLIICLLLPFFLFFILLSLCGTVKEPAGFSPVTFFYFFFFLVIFCIIETVISIENKTTQKAKDKKVTDKELIEKVHRGNKEALGSIISRYYDDIYRFCLYLTGQETDSYDITQEVFLRFIKYVSSYRHRNLKGYLLIIARNLCRDYFYHRKETACMEEAAWLGREDKHLNDLEDSLLLRQALQKLPIEQREIILMRSYEQLPFHEIARITGCPLSTAKSRFRLGVKSLRKILEDSNEQKH